MVSEGGVKSKKSRRGPPLSTLRRGGGELGERVYVGNGMSY